MRAAIKEQLIAEFERLGMRLPTMWNTLDIIDRLDNQGIIGDFVECGVWHGGHMLLAKAYIAEADMMRRKFWLYDTFEGMPQPGSEDVKIKTGRPAMWHEGWCSCPIETVRQNFADHDLLDTDVTFVQGMVEDTLNLPHNLPERIAYLRLDTDWYSSTKVELDVLYPRLVQDGALVIDDYGFWDGSRRATDEYFGRALDFARIDTPARLLFKP